MQPEIIGERGKMAFAIHGVVGVLTLVVRQECRLGNLLVESPLLVKEIGQVQDVDTQLQSVLGFTEVQTRSSPTLR